MVAAADARPAAFGGKATQQENYESQEITSVTGVTGVIGVSVSVNRAGRFAALIHGSWRLIPHLQRSERSHD
jgi:hypothetical protein